MSRCFSSVFRTANYWMSAQNEERNSVFITISTVTAKSVKIQKRWGDRQEYRKDNKSEENNPSPSFGHSRATRHSKQSAVYLEAFATIFRTDHKEAVTPSPHI